MTDEDWMRLAIKAANQAGAISEIPVGAIVVHNEKVIGTGWNKPITTHDPSAHAEMIAVRQAAKYLENYRMIDCTLYVTLEPCPMCAGLLVHSRIKRLVFGASDYKTGCAGSIMNLVAHPSLNHQIEVEHGVLQSECSSMISDFFKRRRAEKKLEKESKFTK
ncbi:tRNA adenosine(34) deaminase TadA [Flocculibacter collagenilyticus]|uniref:tRNA adenosine(34) deaminase TadA n=1 Tax=Flocculibacter collagenilyticus TaxID=2744479 RepID=UPI0018F2FAFF|nr:tRNA adenosine(34) deaminase TadA [Flocculibacter collagenilyticus]